MTVSRKGVSTALATIAIIFVLVMSMVWMGYMLALNAQQQARAAGQAETIALKAKELVRVFIWLDPARQGNTYLNLTRISFVNEWSGETMINSLLIVYRDQPPEVRQVSIKLAAGEEKTYLPSELGLTGLDNYQAALSRLRYIQAHTTLGNDFVSLWGRPDKPALYVSGTTQTITRTRTTTTTSITATTTTATRTTTSYTTTWTTTTTAPPPPGTPVLTWQILENYCTYVSVQFSFNPNGWGTPPYQIRGEWSAANMWGTRLGGGSFGPYTTSGSYSWTVGMSAFPDPQSYGWTVYVIDSVGRVAVWGGGVGLACEYQPPPTTQQPPPGPTTGTTTQQPGTTTYWVTVTTTVTIFSYLSGTAVTQTITVTPWTEVYTISTSTVIITYVQWQTHYYPVLCETWSYAVYSAAGQAIVGRVGPCGEVFQQSLDGRKQGAIYFDTSAGADRGNDTPSLSLMLLGLLGFIDFVSGRRLRKILIPVLATATVVLVIIPAIVQPVSAPWVEATTTTTIYVTNTLSFGTYTTYTTVTAPTTVTYTLIRYVEYTTSTTWVTSLATLLTCTAWTTYYLYRCWWCNAPRLCDAFCEYRPLG